MSDETQIVTDHPNKLVRLIHDVFMCFRSYFDHHQHLSTYFDYREAFHLLSLLAEWGFSPFYLRSAIDQVVALYTPEISRDDPAFKIPPELDAILEKYRVDPKTLNTTHVVEFIKDIRDYQQSDVYTRMVSSLRYQTIMHEIIPFYPPDDPPINTSTYMLVINALYADVHPDIVNLVFDAFYQGTCTYYDIALPEETNRIPQKIQNARHVYMNYDNHLEEQWTYPFTVFPLWNTYAKTHDELLHLFHAVAGLLHHSGIITKDYNERCDRELWPIINKIRIKGLKGVFSKTTVDEFYALPLDVVRTPMKAIGKILIDNEQMIDRYSKYVFAYLNYAKPFIGDELHGIYLRPRTTRAD